MNRRTYKKISEEERAKIGLKLNQGLSINAIADNLEWKFSAVSKIFGKFKRTGVLRPMKKGKWNVKTNSS